MKALFCFSVLFFLFSYGKTAYSQCSIGNPTMDGPVWNESFTIEQNFNNARRWEETNRGWTTNCLGFMTAPSVGWGSLTNEGIAFYIHNEERTDRGLLPLYGVETNLSSLSQAHSDWQITNDVFSHTGNPTYGTGSTYTICPSGTPLGSTPSQRINSSSTLKDCWQLLAENLTVSVASASSSPSFTNFAARSIYGLMYQDSSSFWGHRLNILQVYTNDNGDSGSEGFLGVGVGQGSDFKATAFGCTSWVYAMILTLDYYDPKSSCSGFTFSTALPVELIAFDAREKQGEVHLNWVTASELNSDYFLVERSLDGTNFTKIGKVQAAGFSTKLIDYSYVDQKPKPGTNYYRLRQKDFDGTEMFSTVKAVTIETFAQVSVYPNPFVEFIILKFYDEKPSPFAVEVFDLSGKMLKREIIESSDVREFSITLEWLKPGVYFINVVFNGRRQVQKILKL